MDKHEWTDQAGTRHAVERHAGGFVHQRAGGYVEIGNQAAMAAEILRLAERERTLSSMVESRTEGMEGLEGMRRDLAERLEAKEREMSERIASLLREREEALGAVIAERDLLTECFRSGNEVTAVLANREAELIAERDRFAERNRALESLLRLQEGTAALSRASLSAWAAKTREAEQRARVAEERLAQHFEDCPLT